MTAFPKSNEVSQFLRKRFGITEAQAQEAIEAQAEQDASYEEGVADERARVLKIVGEWPSMDEASRRELAGVLALPLWEEEEV